MKNSKLIVISGIIALSQTGFISSSQKNKTNTNKKPNIIFVLADDLGYGDVGCFGQKTIPTPNIDQLAAEGMKFTNFYSGNSVCAPSRCALMTGLHTGHNTVRNLGGAALDPEDITIPEALEKSDYIKGMSGRWHLGESESGQKPLDNGFDYHFGKLAGTLGKPASYTRPASRPKGNTYGVLIDDLFNKDGTHKKYEEYDSLGIEPMYENGKLYNLEPEFLNNRPVNMDQMVTKKAIDFINKNKEKPFFLYVAYSLVHAPIQMLKKTAMEHPEWPVKEQGFATMLKCIDQFVGQITDAVDKNGIKENTLIIFLSDNGPHAEDGQDPNFFDSNGPLRGIKRDLYEGGIRTPMIARWPGTVEAGSESQLIAAFWDLMPTACELAGVETPKVATDGISFVPTLYGKKQSKHQYLYWEYNAGGNKQAVRMGKWKAVKFIADNRFELYDLEKDLGEQHDISTEYPEIAEQIKKIMQEAHVPSKLFPLLPGEAGSGKRAVSKE